ncbi:hypothetical protein SDC9_112471 [bioreactor metagenome]|uniref:Uncharacterized protein n=1 Tax=bioreactor metagenome TaxID=1076179 RepID=A0A645BUX0_9ZZZZ
MYDQGIEEGALLRCKNTLHRFLIQGIGAKAVDGLGGEGDQLALCKQRSICIDKLGQLLAGLWERLDVSDGIGQCMKEQGDDRGRGKFKGTIEGELNPFIK